VTTTDQDEFAGWAIVEMMGRRRLAGHVRFVQLGGASFLRLDVPGADGPEATQFYSPNAVYCLTPTTEDIARAAAASSRPEPVTRWELERAAPRPRVETCVVCDEAPCVEGCPGEVDIDILDPDDACRSCGADATGDGATRGLCASCAAVPLG
jgi:hypothetical protein